MEGFKCFRCGVVDTPIKLMIVFPIGAYLCSNCEVSIFIGE